MIYVSPRVANVRKRIFDKDALIERTNIVVVFKKYNLVKFFYKLLYGIFLLQVKYRVDVKTDYVQCGVRLPVKIGRSNAAEELITVGAK